MSLTRTSSTASSSASSGTASPPSEQIGEEHIFNSNDFAGLESWGDPTPRPSPFTLKELGDAWVAAAKRQLIHRPKSPTRVERLRRLREHDRKSLMIALGVYAEQNNIQPADLEVIEVKERNLIDEEGKGYVHFNFLVKMQHNPSSLFFAEVHPDCREGEDVYLCTPLEANDSGDCYGCKDRAKELLHPNSGGYLGGHMDIVFPFIYVSGEESEDEA
ncbi:hypothetical protein CFC21_107939 [Triticum aestivum]|uniref:DUF3615 domain-containing protein n=2 Tax=Triticum aestivum TaxID=4565 RepID=A0A9R1NB44_WHEAT|nr:uncharacterized protein LOC123167520 [Triticum aestivum]XP_044441294.1 uncharacterized protein LOC123167520 [Triticum aestivum]KAF7107293.1 hypothetical protein CFC21_107939 [Triticum aestivum]